MVGRLQLHEVLEGKTERYLIVSLMKHLRVESTTCKCPLLAPALEVPPAGLREVGGVHFAVNKNYSS